MKYTIKEKLRLLDLEEKAERRFFAYSDYKVEDWLETKEEIEEYKKLFKKCED